MIGRRITRQPPPAPSLIFQVPGTLGAMFLPQAQYFFEDSAATIPASVGGPVGAVADLFGGINAVQATSANKPTLRQTPQTGIYWLDSSATNHALVATFATALGSNCTVAFASETGVVFLEGQTIGTTYNIAPPYRFNSARLVINRALTDPEKALLTRYLGRFVPGLGPNEFANPGMDSDEAWDKGAGWSIANGVATATRAIGAPAGNLVQFLPLVQDGSFYSYSYNIRRYVSGSPYGVGVNPAVGNNFPPAAYPAAAGPLSLVVVLGGPHGYGIRNGGNTADFDVDDLSLRRIL